MKKLKLSDVSKSVTSQDIEKFVISISPLNISKNIRQSWNPRKTWKSQVSQRLGNSHPHIVHIIIILISIDFAVFSPILCGVPPGCPLTHIPAWWSGLNLVWYLTFRTHSLHRRENAFWNAFGQNVLTEQAGVVT